MDFAAYAQKLEFGQSKFLEYLIMQMHNNVTVVSHCLYNAIGVEQSPYHYKVKGSYTVTDTGAGGENIKALKLLMWFA